MLRSLLPILKNCHEPSQRFSNRAASSSAQSSGKHLRASCSAQECNIEQERHILFHSCPCQQSAPGEHSPGAALDRGLNHRCYHGFVPAQWVVLAVAVAARLPNPLLATGQQRRVTTVLCCRCCQAQTLDTGDGVYRGSACNSAHSW